MYARLYLTLRDQLASRAWTARIVRLAGEILAEARPGRTWDVIVTSGPPHPWHNAGRVLSRRTGIPLVLDLRDPWSTVNVVHEYFATPLWLGITRAHEKRAVEQAALIVTNTPKLQRVMTQLHPDAAAKIITVMNGSDEDPLEAPVSNDSCFRIGYAGVIYLGRDPRPLLTGLATAVRRLRVEPADLQLELMGDVDRYGGVPVIDIARECNAEDFVTIKGRGDRSAALRFMARCHMLISLPWNDSMSVPAKIFEYMRVPAWLLVFASRDSALAELLQGTDADVVAPDDAEGAAAAIERRYLAFKQGARPVPFDQDGRFSRKRQVEILLAALNRVAGATTAEE